MDSSVLYYSTAKFQLCVLLQAPSATLVVKGLSQKTVEDDLYKALVRASVFMLHL